MARPYSEKFLVTLKKLNPNRLGVKLGKICVKANLPTTYVAEAFNVSRMSIHSWFRGQAIRDKNCTRIETFIELVEKGLANGSLPAATLSQAKEYIESKISNKIN